MANPPVMIRIGGSVDASLDRSLQTAVQKATQAEKAVQRQKKETTRAADQEAARQLKAQERTARAAESLDRQRSAGLFRQYRLQEAAAERAAKTEQRAKQRTEDHARKEIEKTFRLASRELDRETRATERAHARSVDRFATRTSHRATRFLMPQAPLGSMAMRALGGVAQGAGIDFSPSNAIARVIDLQQQAIDLSNSAYQPGVAGPNGQRVDPAALIAQARNIGSKYGMDASDVLGGLEQYQHVAGDLDSGRQALERMAALAKATRTSLSDVAAASANVANNLGDIPDKANVVDDVMRTIAGQGKLGAVEISDMATQMARIAAAAGSFSGDRAQNIKEMGALSQIARAEGGAPGAAEAARSMVGFASTMKKGARIKAFQAEGIDVFSDKSHTAIKDPIALIKESLFKTGGDLQRMNKLFMDVVGARTVTGLQKTFVGAGGGQSGLTAIDSQIERMMKAQMSPEQVAQDAKKASESWKSNAQRFQNELDRVNEAAAGKLLPALIQLEEPALKVAGVLGSLASTAAEHPWAAVGTAVAGAITLSIARAGIESAFRAAIESALSRSPMPFGGGGGGGAVGGMALGSLANGGWRTSAGVGLGAGIAASLAWGEAMDQNEQLEKESGGMGALDIGWESLKSWRSPFAVVDDHMNAQAKAEAAQRQIFAANDGGAQPSGGPALVTQLKDDNMQLRQEVERSRQVQQQMLDELRRLNIAAPPDTPAPGGEGFSMTATDDYADGACSSCGDTALLRTGGLLGRPICPTCTFIHGLVPDVLAEYRRRGLGVVEVDGVKIRVGGGRAALLLAQQMVRKHRREAARS